MGIFIVHVNIFNILKQIIYNFSWVFTSYMYKLQIPDGSNKKKPDGMERILFVCYLEINFKSHLEFLAFIC